MKLNGKNIICVYMLVFYDSLIFFSKFRVYKIAKTNNDHNSLKKLNYRKKSTYEHR